mmetsp:Transcript_12219/g.14756  ORF Transcript_12219/g.14756 Transcript_12219/m.14756 type:complete len:97 (+) Transcript_12219:169-459(+)
MSINNTQETAETMQLNNKDETQYNKKLIDHIKECNSAPFINEKEKDSSHQQSRKLSSKDDDKEDETRGGMKRCKLTQNCRSYIDLPTLLETQRSVS